MRNSGVRTWAVLESEGSERLLGIVNQDSLENISGKPLFSLVRTANIPHVFADQPVHLAMELMSGFRLDSLPVVHRADASRLEGIVTMKDVLDSYGVNPVGV